jgi:hypothetical protein
MPAAEFDLPPLLPRQQPACTRHQHRGFTAGPRQHQQGALAVDHRPRLSRIERGRLNAIKKAAILLEHRLREGLVMGQTRCFNIPTSADTAATVAAVIKASSRLVGIGNPVSAWRILS